MFRFPGQGEKSSGGSSSAGKRSQKKKGRGQNSSGGSPLTSSKPNLENNDQSPQTEEGARRTPVRSVKVAALPPDNLKKLRACLICNLIKAEYQFDEDGCDNCESFLRLGGEKGSSLEYTSISFDGFIGMMSSKDSWVAKWKGLGLGNKTPLPGMYAVNVRGEVADWIKEKMGDV